MATRSANVNARVEPDIKEQAEAILEKIGVSVFPTRTLDTMTEEEFNSMMDHGLRQAKEGKSLPVDEAFEKILEKMR